MTTPAQWAADALNTTPEVIAAITIAAEKVEASIDECSVQAANRTMGFPVLTHVTTSDSSKSVTFHYDNGNSVKAFFIPQGIGVE